MNLKDIPECLDAISSENTVCIVGSVGEGRIYRPNPDADAKEFQRHTVSDGLAEAVIQQCSTKITLHGAR